MLDDEEKFIEKTGEKIKYMTKFRQTNASKSIYMIWIANMSFKMWHQDFVKGNINCELWVYS
jgi:hypothetical protein